MITIDDFQKIDLRIGTIEIAERVEGSEKLVKLSVQLGEATPRQILAGIGLHYAPEALVGKQIVVVANLEPRKLMGLESQGMLLASHTAEGGLTLLTTDKPATPGGTVG